MSDAQERSHGQGKPGRMTLISEDRVSLKMSNHQLDLIKQKLSIIGAPVGKLEAERARAELASEIDLVMRTISGVMGRGA
jgi:predicted DNA binding CopG/RHH family protein